MERKLYKMKLKGGLHWKWRMFWAKGQGHVTRKRTQKILPPAAAERMSAGSVLSGCHSHVHAPTGSLRRLPAKNFVLL